MTATGSTVGQVLKPQLKDGHLEPGDGPGLGVELNREEAAKHPYGQSNFLRLFEEGWERRETE